MIVGRAVPGHQASPVEPEDLHGAKTPAMALRVQPGKSRRHDAPAETTGNVQPRPAGSERPKRGLGVFADAPLVPATDTNEGAAPEQAHGTDERNRVPLVPGGHDRQVKTLIGV